MLPESSEEEREHLRRAHEYLMQSTNYLGRVYQMQVKRVRELKKQLEELKR